MSTTSATVGTTQALRQVTNSAGITEDVLDARMLGGTFDGGTQPIDPGLPDGYRIPTVQCAGRPDRGCRLWRADYFLITLPDGERVFVIEPGVTPGAPFYWAQFPENQTADTAWRPLTKE